MTAGVATDEELATAFRKCRGFTTEPVRFESFVPGDDYHSLLAKGTLVGAIQRDPPGVLGYGRSTVRNLVAVPERRRNH